MDPPLSLALWFQTPGGKPPPKARGHLARHPMSAAAPPAASTLPPALHAELGEAVRLFLQHDDASRALALQCAKARASRAAAEARVVGLLQRGGLQGATMRVGGGGTLCLATRREAGPLTWTLLEALLPAYFKASGVRDDTGGLLAFLRERRGAREAQFLKR